MFTRYGYDIVAQRFPAWVQSLKLEGSVYSG